MKKKIVTYEEVKISEKLRKKCIEYLENNPISIYWDYRTELSLEQVEKIMTSQEEYYNVENELWENNIDYIFDLQCELLNNMKEEFPELEEIEIASLRDEFLDFLSVNMDIKQLIKNTPDVRIRVVIHSNYEGVGWQQRGEGNFKDSEYIREVKKLLKGKYEEKSFQQELDNICSSCNQLIFYFKGDVENLIGIKEKFKKSITIPKNSWCGFYDNWNGSGSVLEVKLLDDIKLKKQWGKTEYDSVDIVLDENNKYSVEEVYGLCNVPECELTVK